MFKTIGIMDLPAAIIKNIYQSLDSHDQGFVHFITLTDFFNELIEQDIIWIMVRFLKDLAKSGKVFQNVLASFSKSSQFIEFAELFKAIKSIGKIIYFNFDSFSISFLCLSLYR